MSGGPDRAMHRSARRRAARVFGGLCPAAAIPSVQGQSAPERITEDLMAERMAREGDGAMMLVVRNDDPTTGRVLEVILAGEEEQA